jgi:hypothetical protein
MRLTRYLAMRLADRVNYYFSNILLERGCLRCYRYLYLSRLSLILFGMGILMDGLDFDSVIG